MSEQKRRFLEGNSATPTFIGAESVFVGNIRGAGHFVVSGEVHGDGELQGALEPVRHGKLARLHPGGAGRSSPARSRGASASRTNWKSATPP